MEQKYKQKKPKSKKKIFAVIALFVMMFCVIFLAARGKVEVPLVSKTAMVVLSPFQNFFSWAGSQITFLKRTVTEIQYLHKQNRQLREEVELLRAQNLTASEYASENQRLRALLGYKQVAIQFDLVAAGVIGRESVTWSSVITINRGTVDGVANNMAVVTEMGLVGHVLEAGANTSKVQLILDPRSSVGTLVQRADSRVAGIVEGDMNNPTHPRMVNIPKDADVQVEDAVVTSGFGGVYPKGIVVGKIKEIHNDEGGLLKYGVIETSVNFEKLEDVAVIVNSREAPPEPLPPILQTQGTETDPHETAEQIKQAQENVQQQQQQQLQQAQEKSQDDSEGEQP
ncbi:MAG: rod shape-determining protein MreC [Selenomonadaceae bacterium]|nr:rod shape-determining protein MreC [Selenomonadaceae bacterium]